MKSTNKFNVGDIVKMSKTGKKKYSDYKTNPHHKEGIIIDFFSYYTVKWNKDGDEEIINTYDEPDLELVREKELIYEIY